LATIKLWRIWVYDNIQDIHIPNVFGSEKIAMEQVASLAKEIGFSDSRIEDLKTAVSEACINAIEHGNKMNSSTRVVISLSIDKKRLKVSVEDIGNGIKRNLKEPDIEKKIEGTEPTRGWGVFLIKKLVDDLQFEPKADGGNVTTMVIHLDNANHTDRAL
jgi:serine/threonine-protein kinase RsbW